MWQERISGPFDTTAAAAGEDEHAPVGLSGRRAVPGSLEPSGRRADAPGTLRRPGPPLGRVAPR